MSTSNTVRFRAAIVYGAVSAVAGSGVVVALGVLGSAPQVVQAVAAGSPDAFAAAIELVAAAVGVVAAGYLWWVTTLVVGGVLRGATPRPRGLARTLILAACGCLAWSPTLAQAATLPATTLPATTMQARPAHSDSLRAESANTRPSLQGLPLPDRAAGGPSPHAGSLPAGAADDRELVVRAGDALWTIARRVLSPGSSDGAVADYVAALHDRNRPTIGPDPDVLLPGQRLEIPAPGSTLGHST